MAIVFALPIAHSVICNISKTENGYKLAEKGGEEDRTDEKESEKESSEQDKEFLSQNLVHVVQEQSLPNQYPSRNSIFASICTDVLTPPPESV